MGADRDEVLGLLIERIVAGIVPGDGNVARALVHRHAGEELTTEDIVVHPHRHLQVDPLLSE